MAANVLTEPEKVQLCEWLCEGLTDAEVLDKLQATLGKVISREQVWQYRKKYREQMDEAEAEALEFAKRRGYGRRTYRVKRLCVHLAKMDDVLEREAIAKWGQLPKDYLSFSETLRKELGQDAPSKLELSGPDGGPVQVDVFPHLSAAELAAIAQEPVDTSDQ